MAKDPFESPKLLVAGAHEDTAEIEQLVNDFMDNKYGPSRHWAKAISQDGRAVKYGMKVYPPPSKVRRKAPAVLNDLRHALDQATYASCVAVGRGRSNTYFPFGDDPDDLDTVFNRTGKSRGRSSDVDPDLIPYLKSLEPYWQSPTRAGGNDLLRGLGYHTGPNKHRAVVGTSIGSDEVRPRHVTNGILRLPFEWDDQNSTFWFAYTNAPDHFEMSLDISAFVAFDGLRGIPAAPLPTVLKNLTSMVESIVSGIEAETARLLKERAA